MRAEPRPYGNHALPAHVFQFDIFRSGVVSMRKLAFLPVGALLALGFLLPGQDGPKKDVGETVARPRKKGDPVEAEQPKIPSKLTRKDQLGISDQPDFKV